LGVEHFGTSFDGWVVLPLGGFDWDTAGLTGPYIDVRRRLREYADATGTYPKARPAPIDIKMNSLVELQGGS